MISLQPQRPTATTRHAEEEEEEEEEEESVSSNILRTWIYGNVSINMDTHFIRLPRWIDATESVGAKSWRAAGRVRVEYVGFTAEGWGLRAEG